MRKKRSESAARFGGVKVILVLFFIIPLLGIALGYGVSKMIIIPYLTQHQEGTSGGELGQTPPGDTTGAGSAEAPDDTSPQNSQQENDEAMNAYRRVFEVEGFDLYRIQVGAFSSQENALKLAEELNEKGMASAVDTEGLHKVYVLYSFTREAAEAALDKVRVHYPDAHISKTGFPSVEIGFPESSSKEAGMLKDQLKECAGMLIQITAEDAAGENIESIVNEKKDRLGLFQAENNKTDWPPDMEEYREAAAAYYTAALESLSEYNRQNAIPGQTSMELINCYVELLKRLGTVI